MGDPETDAEAFNARYPVGTSVRYRRGRADGDGVESVTRSAASVVGGTAVVWIEGVGGRIALSHVEALS